MEQSFTSFSIWAIFSDILFPFSHSVSSFAILRAISRLSFLFNYYLSPYAYIISKIFWVFNIRKKLIFLNDELARTKWGISSALLVRRDCTIYKIQREVFNQFWPKASMNSASVIIGIPAFLAATFFADVEVLSLLIK